MSTKDIVAIILTGIVFILILIKTQKIENHSQNHFYEYDKTKEGINYHWKTPLNETMKVKNIESFDSLKIKNKDKPTRKRTYILLTFLLFLIGILIGQKFF